MSGGRDNNGGVQAVRKSIKKYQTLGAVMSKGCNNPITIHAADEQLFAVWWSIMAETLVVCNELKRSEKEQISLQVAKNNKCKVCITAHAMMAVAASKKKKKRKGSDDSTASSSDEDERLRQILAYSKLLQKPGDFDESDKEDFPLLNEQALAEIAMVVLVKQHLNRAVSVIVGEEMSSAMMGVPRGVAKKMESQGVMKVMNNMMAPFLSGGMKKSPKPGITANLFPENGEVPELPLHLQGAIKAGPERAAALARLHALQETLYESRLREVISEQVLELVEVETSAPSEMSVQPRLVVTWLEPKLEPLENEKDKTVAMALLLTTVFPHRLNNSKQWEALEKAVGKEEARLAVIWWSIRLTLAHAKGLA